MNTVSMYCSSISSMTDEFITNLFSTDGALASYFVVYCLWGRLSLQTRPLIQSHILFLIALGIKEQIYYVFL